MTFAKDGSMVLRSMLNEKYVVSINNQQRGFSWLSEYSGAGTEHWVAEKLSNGNYLLKLSLEQNMVLDVEAAKYEENRVVQVYGRKTLAGENQQWIFQRVGGFK